MPGMMPQMPGIMGAPMGPPPGMPPMGGMPGMPPMPMGGMPPPMPMPMGGPMGGPPPQGGRPASLGTLPAPSTAAQRAGFGAAVGAVASGPVAGAMPADVFAGGIPGGMMDASIPRPVAMMRGGGSVQYMQGGGVAKPNMREFMEATGVDAATASQALYGSVGSNVDIRDWDAIMSSGDPLRATQEATRQMYSTGAPIATDPRFYDPETKAYTPTAVARDYDVRDVAGGPGAPRIQMYDNQLMVVDAAGLPLTGLTPQNAASFGVTQDQIDAAVAAAGITGERAGRFQGVGYQPYDAGSLLRSGYESLLTDPPDQKGGDPAAAFRKTFDEIVSGGGIGDVAIKSYQQTGKILPGYESLISAYEAAPAGTYVAPSSGTTRGEPEGGPVGMNALRDSAGDIVPGMFVMRYADGTYSRPGTVLEVEGLRQGLLSGERTSGSLGLEDVRSIADQNQYLKTNGVTVSDVSYAGAGQPFSNEQLGSDMVTVRFADGSMVSAQKGMVDVMQASGALGGMQSAGDFSRAMVELSAASVDPESESARLMNMFNERQLAYNAALQESDPNIARNIDAYRAYAGSLSGQPIAGAGMPAGVVSGAPAGGVNPYEATNIYADRGILDQQRGFYEGELDVLRQQLSDLQAAYAGPRYTGVLEPSSYGMPEGASYQPTMGTIPTFTRGMSDVFGTRPVTYYGSPQASITSGIGSIDLPARPESVNVFDWLANPVGGVGLYRPGGAS